MISIGDNVASVWDSYLDNAVTDWSRANNIDFVETAGRSAAQGCRAVYGTVQACSGNYGATGWLGYATVWTSGGFVVQATVKLNDHYFTQPKYNTDAWRRATMCQEVGHTLGLGHADVNRNNSNLGTCMDYTNDPTGTAGGRNGTLANLHASASDFAALDGIYATPAGNQLSYTRPESRAGEGLSIDDHHHSGAEVVAYVPEPATWALFITGFGAVGASLRRRRGFAAV